MRGGKVDFALLLYDEFNGAPITDPNVLFRWEGRNITPLRKREGFYVFCGLDCPEIALEISRPHYLKKNRRIIKNRLDPGNPVVRERLMRAYPGTFSDCEWLHGTCPPDSEVLAFSDDEQIKLQIQEDDGARIAVMGYATARLAGRRFAIERESGETFFFTQMLTPGVYRADRELPAALKGPRPAIRAWLSKSGPDGCYHIPVERGQAGGFPATAFYREERGKWVFQSVTERK